jgi:hypothetical protein
LYVIFAMLDGGLDRHLGETRKRIWTAPEGAQPGDRALFYFGRAYRGIYAIGRTKREAEPGELDDWAQNERGWFFTPHEAVTKRKRPLSLAQIRKAFPEWRRWINLRGVRAQFVPLDLEQRLASLLAEGNPSAKELLEPWLQRDEPRPNQGTTDRPLVSARRRLRDAEFGRLVRGYCSGRCCACPIDTDYDRLGILEAAQVRSVEAGGSDDLSNALPLCPNHHGLFDEGRWTLDGESIVLSQSVPR